MFAQFDTATFVGTVKDDTGGVIPGATVTLTNLDTGIAATRVTDENGNFEFQTVRIGRYKVTAELEGFSVALADNVQATVGARQRVDFTMKPGALSETVEVVGAATRLETDSSQRGQVVTAEQAVELPLNGREYSGLVLLSPGVRVSSLSTGGSPREGSFNINGLRSTFNNYMLDGLDNNAYGTSNQGFSNQLMQPSPDARCRVQGRHQQHGRGVRPQRRRDGQRGVEERHQQLPRRGLGVLPRHEPERDRVLQAGQRPEASARAQPVRRRVRRPHRPEQGVLLRRIRGVPADARHTSARSRSRRCCSSRASCRSTCATRAPGSSTRPARRSR